MIEVNKCNVCNSKLQDARVLTCLHRYCSPCIFAKLYSGPLPDNHSISGLNPDEKIKCQDCGQASYVKDLVKDILTVPEDDVSNSEPLINFSGICTACKSGEASIRKCYTCDADLCESCVSARQAMRCFESHKTDVSTHSNALQLNGFPPCDTHPEELVNYYCSTCKAYCCSVCLKLNHMDSRELSGKPPHINHQINDAFVKKEKEHLELLLKDAKEKLSLCEEFSLKLDSQLSDLSSNKENVKKSIEKQYQTLKALIDKFKEQLLEQLNSLHQQRRIQLWEMINNCEKTMEKIEDGSSYAKMFLEKKDSQTSFDYVRLLEKISAQLSDLISKPITSEGLEFGIESNFTSPNSNQTTDYLLFDPPQLSSIEIGLLPRIFGNVKFSSPSNEVGSPIKKDTPSPIHKNGNDIGMMKDTLGSPTTAISSMGPSPNLASDTGSHLSHNGSGKVSCKDIGMSGNTLISSCPNLPMATGNRISHFPRTGSVSVNTPEPMISQHYPNNLTSNVSLSTGTTPEPGLIQDAAHPLASAIRSTVSSAPAPVLSNNSQTSNSNGVIGQPILGNLSSGPELDLNNIMTNITRLATMYNQEEGDTNSRQSIISSGSRNPLTNNAPSPQSSSLTPSVPLDSNFFLNEAAMKNLNELAKLTNGLGSSLSGTLTSPTPPSSSANTPPLNFGSRTGNNVNIMQIRCKFGQLGQGRGQFSSPHGFCLGVDEEIVIADTNNHRICIFDKNGEFKHMFGNQGKDEGQLWYPRKVAIIRSSTSGGSTPRYVICDRGSERSRMQIFSRTGHFIRKIAIRYIDIVAGLAITPAGHIVAVDSVSPTVFVIAETGDLLRWFDCAEHMREPSDIAVCNNEYYVCDFKGHCVVVFSEDGEFKRRIGRERITNFPNGIDISDAGDVLIGDSHGNRFHVVVFDKTGNLLSEFECPYVKVSRCCGLKITSEGYVVTLAKNNHHVLILNTLYIM